MSEKEIERVSGRDRLSRLVRVKNRQGRMRV